jgi:hypothetical protein
VRRLEEVVRKGLTSLEDSGRWRGLIVGAASGVGVSVLVAQTFLGWNGWAAIGLGALACLCTTLGTIAAVRASSTGKAVLWVLGLNVLPPTLVFLPTLIGLFWAVPAGLLAFAVVLPLALLARAARQRPDRPERELLLGAGFTALAAAALAFMTGILAGTPHHAWWAPGGPNVLAIPMLIAALVTLVLASAALARELRRAWIVVRAKRAGFVVAHAGAGQHLVSIDVSIGSGPHRSARSTEDLGTLWLSPVRTALSLAAVAVAVVLVGSSLAAV